MKRHALLMLTSLLLLLGFSFGSSAAQVCVANTTGEFIGPACTAETIAMPATWSMTQAFTVVQTQKFLFFVTAFFFATAILCISHKSQQGLSWFNTRVNVMRTGPAPNNIFLPYLFATHGW